MLHQIFRFLKDEGVELIPSLWIDVIHDKNADLIHLLEDYNIEQTVENLIEQKVVEIDNQFYDISVLDTAGQDDFAEMRFSYYNQVQGFVLVFDITNQQSIEDIKNIYQDIEDTFGSDDICCVIAANKADLRDESRTDLIPISEYKKIEEFFHCKVIETSSKTGLNIDNLFNHIIRLIISNHQKNTKSTSALPENKEAVLKYQNQRLERRRLPIRAKPSNKPKKTTEDFNANSKSCTQIDQQQKVQQMNEEAHLRMIDELATLLEKQTKEAEALNVKIKELQQILIQKDKEIESKTDLLLKSEIRNKELESKLRQQQPYQRPKIFRNQKKEIQIYDVDEIDHLNQIEKVGHGPISEVIKVIRNQPYALKILDEKFRKNDENDDKLNINSDNFKKFKHECEILNQIENPSIIKIFGICLGDKIHRPSILIEYFPQNLNTIVSTFKKSEKISIIFEICEAMKHVHHLGIIHRDLKPSNIFIDSEKRVKLSDFGISALINVDSKIDGSYQFMAPELIRCVTDYDEKVDVYSFGVVVYFVLTGGELPELSLSDHEKGNLPSIPDKINEFSKNLICKCMAADSKDRPSFDEIVETIEQNDFKLIDGIDRSSFEF